MGIFPEIVLLKPGKIGVGTGTVADVSQFVKNSFVKLEVKQLLVKVLGVSKDLEVRRII